MIIYNALHIYLHELSYIFSRLYSHTGGMYPATNFTTYLVESAFAEHANCDIIIIKMKHSAFFIFHLQTDRWCLLVMPFSINFKCIHLCHKNSYLLYHKNMIFSRIFKIKMFAHKGFCYILSFSKKNFVSIDKKSL